MSISVIWEICRQLAN